MYISYQMFILIMALAIAFVVMAVGLLFTVAHYRWRLQDSHRKLYRFIRENLHLHDELERNTSETRTTAG